MIHPRSLIEVGEIGLDAVKLVREDAVRWLGDKVAQLDEWLSDYGNAE